MTRRLSLAGQLLALQVVIICVVLVGVAAVTVAQLTQGAEQTEGRRAQAIAETLANARATREAMAENEVDYLRVAAEGARSISGSESVVVARADRTVVASADPAQLDTRLDLGESTVLEGRSWTGDTDFDGGRAAVAMAPILAPRGAEPLGLVAVQRPYPGCPGRPRGGGPEPADLPRPGQRPRHRGLAAARPPGEAADPRAWSRRRSPASSSTATPCSTASGRGSSAWTSGAG